MNLHQFSIFLKKLSFKKILNAIILYVNYFISKTFKLSIRKAFPVGISIEPTSICNLKCPQCPTGREELNRYNGNIDIDLFKIITDECAPYLLNLILYFQGEPYLNKNIFEMIDYASKKKNIFTTTSTNGHFLNEENVKKTIDSGLDKLIISVDGTDQETYEKYRKKGKLEDVITGIKTLVSYKEKVNSKKPIIVLQFLVFKFNEHQIDNIKSLSKELGVDKLELKSAQIYDFENNSELIPTIDKYSRYKKDINGNFQIKSKLKNKCKRMWESAVITNTGDLLHCCFDKDASYTYGNLKNSSFKKLNNSEKAIDFRAKLFHSRKQIYICKNCTEGLRK